MYKLVQALMCIFIVCHLSTALAQSIDSLFTEGDMLENEKEFISEETDSEPDLADLEDELSAFRHHPVNLNSMQPDELRKLPVLNEQQVQNLLTYTSSYGKLASIYELQLIEGFNQEFIEQIAPFISLDFPKTEPFSWKKAIRYSHVTVSTRYQRVLQPQGGYADCSDSLRALHPSDYFLGDPGAFLLKITSAYKDRLKIGLLAEKDAGEPFTGSYDSKKPGFDFYSGYAYLKDLGKIRQLVLGDYHLHFGQGLTFWSGFSYGMSGNSLAARKRASPISPSGSSNESSFLRGTAITLGFAKLLATAFYSNCHRDGNLIIPDSLTEEEAYISALQTTGYHRTETELADKRTLRQIIFGGNITYTSHRLRIGITSYELQYDKQVLKKPDVYSRFQGIGSKGGYGGIDFSYSYKRLLLYGECSLQDNGGAAGLFGLSLTPDPKLSFSAVYRQYSTLYLNPFSAGFGVNPKNTNERSLYLGMATTPSKNLSVLSSVDISRFPWLKFRVDSPSRGIESNFLASYALGKSGSINLRFRQATSAVSREVPPRHLASTEDTRKSILQFQFRYTVTPWLSLQNRIYYQRVSVADNSPSTGYYFSQEVTVKPAEYIWSACASIILFDTDNNDARIYAYEHDLPSSFSVPAMSGKGYRYYVMVRLNSMEKWECDIRYSSTIYPGKHSLSSGTAQIDGNCKSEIKLFLKYH